MEKLRRHFSGLETAIQEGQYTLAGQPAALIHFEAKHSDETPVKGDVHVMAHKGIGYVFFSWTTAEHYGASNKELQAMRDRLRVLNKRDKWVEKVSNRTVFAPAGASYQVEDTEGAWHDRSPAAEDKDARRYVVEPKDLDPLATLGLIGLHPDKLKDSKKVNSKTDYVPSAEALVLVLDKKGGDAIAAARDYALERARKDAGAEVALEEVTDSPSETPLPSGGPAISR